MLCQVRTQSNFNERVDMHEQESISDPEAILNRRFWLIILESFSLEDINNLDGYAQAVESCTTWSNNNEGTV
jgi:hypothetical protein